jgi:hypothetical protein
MGDARGQNEISATFQHQTTPAAMRMRCLSAILLVAGLIETPRLAQAQLSESPITLGFWSFANRKFETTQDVRAACRNYTRWDSSPHRCPLQIMSGCIGDATRPQLFIPLVGLEKFNYFWGSENRVFFGELPVRFART